MLNIFFIFVKRMRNILIIFVIFASILFYLIFITKNVLAIYISTEAPQEVLVRGQVFDWKINIDTQGESIKKQEFYFTYEKEYVEFQSLLAGDFFDNVSYSKVEEGKLYVIGESSAPKSGSGLVAIAKMKIIASAPGASQLCAVVPITPTPTGQPTNTPAPTSPYATNTPRPTVLPTSGGGGQLLSYAFFTVVFLALAAIARVI